MNRSEKSPSFKPSEDDDSFTQELVQTDYSTPEDDNISTQKLMQTTYPPLQLNLREERRASRPDIFINPDENIIKSNIDNYSKKINSAIINKIFKKHRDNFETCNIEIALYLSSVLGLNKPPHIRFESRNNEDNALGCYSSFKHEVTIYYKENRDKKTTPEDINNVAHEIWHAHQHLVADEVETDPNSELYKKNFDDYVTPEENKQGYWNQLVEVEARAFAEHFSNKYDITKTERLKNKILGNKVLVACILAGALATEGALLSKMINKTKTLNHYQNIPRIAQSKNREMVSFDTTNGEIGRYYDNNGNLKTVELIHENTNNSPPTINPLNSPGPTTRLSNTSPSPYPPISFD